MVSSAIILISIVLASCRIVGITDEFFQAVAHLWVGGIIGAAVALHFCLKCDPLEEPDLDLDFFYSLCIIVSVVLSLVELICFLFSRFH